MYPPRLKSLPPDVRIRVAVERKIVRCLVREFAEQGYTFLVDDGGEEFIPCETPKEALAALMNTDEDQLGIVNIDGETIGWVKLVYGNEGWDVVSDYHTVLETEMPKTLKLIDKLS